MVKSSFFFFFFIAFLTACSSGQRENRLAINKFYQEAQYQKGLDFINKNKDLIEDSKLKLLVAMERGSFLYQLGLWEEAAVQWEMGKALLDEFYTMRISGKLAEATSNANAYRYEGESFENSMLFYNLALAYLQVYQQQKKALTDAHVLTEAEARIYLFKARATILAWDGYLVQLKQENDGKSVFKQDLLAKVLGAIIHELIGSRQDDQIAYQLWQDAQTIRFRYYNAYPSFNNKASEFSKDFAKLPGMKEDAIKKNYVETTNFAEDLDQFISTHLNDLKTRLNPKPVKSKTSQALELSSLVFFLNDSLVPMKTPRLFDIGLGQSAEQTAKGEKASAGQVVLGVAAAAFAAQVLGIGASSSSQHRVFQNGVETQATYHLVSELRIQFEIPMIEPKKVQHRYALEVWNKEGKVKLQSTPLTLINPLSDLANQALQEKGSETYTKTGLRVAGKHIAAIIAAFGTYKLMGGGGSNESPFAKLTAMAEYFAANKVIAASEKADTRCWSTLGQNIRMTKLSMPAGEYQIKLVELISDQAESKLIQDLGLIALTPKQTLVRELRDPKLSP